MLLYNIHSHTHIEAQHLNNWSKDDEYVKIIWDKLQKSALFSDYLTTEEDSFNVDKSFVIDFLERSLLQIQNLQSILKMKILPG